MSFLYILYLKAENRLFMIDEPIRITPFHY